MDVTEAIAARRSVRGFLDAPVDPTLLHDLAVKASRAATGGNLQPWHIAIVQGDSMTRLKATMAEKLATGEAETPAYDVYPRDLVAPYRDRRYAVGEAMYAHLGIPRDDKPARREWFAQNFQFFGAPAAYFCTVDRRMGPPQWSDLGMYLQNLMLLAVDAGLATCPQECWAMYPETVGRVLDLPEDRMLFCGMAIGYEDKRAPANALRTERADEAEWLTTIS
ncbi:MULTISPECIES: nitroreductase [unclassified Sphingomonas]|uniref:nitroreductase n=1 Tax=unclassified Sphingomonas TaxID=196159 RepID=UPI000E73A3E2|nr:MULTISPECIES: nitroreductase [unclassified Sphingomonas]RKE47210.1 nitroreductase [Sphingomonas sp. PP-CC-1A-547]TCM07764.1 nitroreductase [Sphingomonas sp. PP-CC-3G-468]